MIRFVVGFYVLLYVTAGFAQEVGTAQFPCAVIGKPGGLYHTTSGLLDCMTSYQPYQASATNVDTQLSARRLQELQAMSTKMDTMVQTIAALKGSIDNLNAAIQQLNTSNTAWKQHTLDATVKTIEATPQRIAENDSVIKVLALRIADTLKTNQEFIKALPDGIAADPAAVKAIADKAAERLAHDPLFVAKIKSAKP